MKQDKLEKARKKYLNKKAVVMVDVLSASNSPKARHEVTIVDVRMAFGIDLLVDYGDNVLQWKRESSVKLIN